MPKEEGFNPPESTPSSVSTASSISSSSIQTTTKSGPGGNKDDDSVSSPSAGNKEYESSELSDLGEDQSEAETDKMDFLDEENSNSEAVLDLNTLLKLTELARLKEIDSDDDLDETSVKNENNADSSNNGNNGTTKRSLDPEDDTAVKKPKLDEKQATGANSEDEHEGDDEGDDEADDETERNHADASNGHAEINGDHKDEHEGEHEGEHELANKQEDEEEEGHAEDEAHAEDEDEEEEEEDEEDEEDVTLNELRVLAVQDLITIEKTFAEIRDKLYHDKLRFLEHELQLCLDGSHPELAKIYYKINEFYQDSIRLANHTLNYRLRCINNETVATRTFIHQDFMRKLTDGKYDMIQDTTSKWYKINKERNQMDQLVPDFSFGALPEPVVASEPVPVLSTNTHEYNGYQDGLNGNGYPYRYEQEVTISKKELKQTRLIELVQQRNNYNQQLGILNGLVQLHGLPTAIDLSPEGKLHSTDELLLKLATDDEVAEDFRAMGIPI